MIRLRYYITPDRVLWCRTCHHIATFVQRTIDAHISVLQGVTRCCLSKEASPSTVTTAAARSARPTVCNLMMTPRQFIRAALLVAIAVLLSAAAGGCKLAPVACCQLASVLLRSTARTNLHSQAAHTSLHSRDVCLQATATKDLFTMQQLTPTHPQQYCVRESSDGKATFPIIHHVGCISTSLPP